MGASRHRTRWRSAAAVAAALSVIGVAACSQPAAAERRFFRIGAAAPAPGGPPALTLVPAAGAAGVSVQDLVRASVVGGTLESVTLTDAQGRQVDGAFDPSRTGWQPGGPLAYNRTYTLTAKAVRDGQAVSASSTFATVKPRNLTMPYLRANAGLLLADRQTYGVGQVVEVGFDEKIPNRAAAEQSLEVITTPHVDGGWYWVNGTTVHWRPQNYWPSGTKVTVNARLYGRDLGNGLYGQADRSASFTIGQSKIAIADDNTHQIQVTIDGQPVRTIPTAMGLHSYLKADNGEAINLRTHSGVHVVLGNAKVTHMSSATFGLSKGPDAYSEDVYWTTHISYSGEYVHAAPWSVAQQGHTDASHGCLNVNTDNAIWFFNTFGPGDVVDVRNTGYALPDGDGLTDWNVSWADWLKGSALAAAPAAPAA